MTGQYSPSPVRHREPVHFSENYRPLRRIRPTTSLLLASALIMQLQITCALADFSEINALLDAAEAAERQDHLIYPASGSAMSLYHEVLFNDPDNADAITGLTRLAEHYLEQAQVALEKGATDRRALLTADSFVSKARMIYPDYPAVDTMAHQIELLENAKRIRETLDWQLVAQRSDSLTAQLRRLGGIAKKDDCRVTINVSNDAEGRWVFQKMNTAPGEQRVRARVEIASPAAIHILCFQDAADAD